MSRRRALTLLLGLLWLIPGQVTPAASQGAWGIPWTSTPSVVILSRDGDRRVPAAQEAVAFWNKVLADLGTPFRLGPVTHTIGAIPADELRALGMKVVGRRGPAAMPEGLRALEGNVILALSDAEFVSFAARWPSLNKALVAIKTDRSLPLSLPNVTRNVIAHELGHAIGLGHNDDPTKLMCGRPAPCRPNVFSSGKPGFFPLTDGEKASLLDMYSATWKSR